MTKQLTEGEKRALTSFLYQFAKKKAKEVFDGKCDVSTMDLIYQLINEIRKEANDDTI